MQDAQHKATELEELVHSREAELLQANEKLSQQDELMKQLHMNATVRPMLLNVSLT